MKNQKQLLNKENWLKYLQLADEGGLTNNAKANDIISMIEKVISVTHCCKSDSELLNQYNEFINTQYSYNDLSENDTIDFFEWFNCG